MANITGGGINTSFKLESEYLDKAFSGANLTAYFNNIKVGTLQSITVSITREVAPIYVMGSANPRAFVKGKRGIAGSLVFTQFDKHALLEEIFKSKTGKGLYGTSLDQVSQFDFSNGQTGFTGGSVGGQNISNNPDFSGASIDIYDSNALADLNDAYSNVASRLIEFSDQIPPFDVTITLVNELGDAATAAIYGVTIVNEGWGFSLDDLTNETAYTYVARSIRPLESVTRGSS